MDNTTAVSCEEARGHSELYSAPGSQAHHVLGPEKPGQYFSCLRPRSPESLSRLPVSHTAQQRVVTSCADVRVDPVFGSQSRSRSICILLQLQNQEVLHLGPLQPGLWNRFPDRVVELQHSVHLSPAPDHPQVLREASSGSGQGGGDSALLAEEAMVSPPDPAQLPESGASSSQTRPSFSGAVLHPCPALRRLMVWFLRGKG